MTLFFIFLGEAIASSLLTYFYTPIPKTWAFCWSPVVMVPVFYLLAFGFYAFLLWVGSLFLSKKENEGIDPFVLWLAHETSWQLLFLSRSHLQVTGLEKLPKEEGFLLISNHTSQFDQIALLGLLKGRRVLCVTKPENEEIFIAGKWLKRAGYIAINRDNNFEGLKAIIKATRVCKEKRASVIIAPEGTRSKSGVMLPFKPGSFKIATMAKAPIVVVAIQNSRYVSKRFPWRSTTIYLDFLEVIAPEQFKDGNTIALAERTQKEIQADLSSHQSREYASK
jgi:1-acyl-sn-glycerol-3-phosphate acyltransferase